MGKEGNHPPKPDCKFCQGTGKKYVKKLKIHAACICIFVDHEHCEELGKSLSEFARRELMIMKGGHPWHNANKRL